jgi:hypothetical protein
MTQKGLSTESSPSDPPSARSRMPVGTDARTCTNRHPMRANEGPSGAVSC